MSVDVKTRFFIEPIDGTHMWFWWVAKNKQDFERIIRLLRANIPANARNFDKGTKRWAILEEHRGAVDLIVREVETGGEAMADLDREIREDSVLSEYSEELARLPPAMKKRALFAIRVSAGIEDGEFSYSYSRNQFGALCDDGYWFYTDGTYSASSPKELDAKALAASHKKMSGFMQRYNNAFDTARTIEQYEKTLFRSEMLARYNHECYTCKSRPERISQLHMHRVLPGRNGGLYVADNVVILCAKCHGKHEGKSWDEIHEVAQS